MIFGSAWTKYDENSETYRLTLERNAQQRIELQVIKFEISRIVCDLFRSHLSVDIRCIIHRNIPSVLRG